MKEYNRKYPLYSLCGLNCGLCPNYHSDKSFICPSCGGKDFYSIHPTCSIITCSQKHGSIEFCFLCEEYPCDKYAWTKERVIYDSFISYQNVAKDRVKVKAVGIENYCAEQKEKTELLGYLLANYNSGRQKIFFCLAVNLLELSDIKAVLAELVEIVDEASSLKENSKLAVGSFNKKAEEKGIILKLNKKI